MELASDFQQHTKSQCFDVINYVSRSVSFRLEKSSIVMAVLNSHQQRSVTCKYWNIGKTWSLKGYDKHVNPNTAKFSLRKVFR